MVATHLPLEPFTRLSVYWRGRAFFISRLKTGALLGRLSFVCFGPVSADILIGLVTPSSCVSIILSDESVVSGLFGIRGLPVLPNW